MVRTRRSEESVRERGKGSPDSSKVTEAFHVLILVTDCKQYLLYPSSPVINSTQPSPSLYSLSFSLHHLPLYLPLQTKHTLFPSLFTTNSSTYFFLTSLILTPSDFFLFLGVFSCCIKSCGQPKKTTVETYHKWSVHVFTQQHFTPIENKGSLIVT